MHGNNDLTSQLRYKFTDQMRHIRNLEKTSVGASRWFSVKERNTSETSASAGHLGSSRRMKWTISRRVRQNTRRWQKYIRISRILVKRQKYPTKQTEGGTPNVNASREFYADRRCSILRPCFKSTSNLIRNLTDQ